MYTASVTLSPSTAREFTGHFAAAGLCPRTLRSVCSLSPRAATAMTPSGWNLDSVALSTVTHQADGSLHTAIKFPTTSALARMEADRARPRARGSAYYVEQISSK